MRFSPAARLSLGLVFITLSILLTADLFGLTPRGSDEALDSRRKFAEVLAVVFSNAVQNNDQAAISDTMEIAVARNADLHSMGLRQINGDLVASAGAHETHWLIPPNGESTPTHWQVPIFRGEEQWGTVEVAYTPLPGTRLFGLAVTPLIALLVFAAIAGFFGYRLLLRKALRHLDPSAVIPRHVQSTLDVLAEGVAIFDEKSQIVLANAAFGKTTGHDLNGLLGKKAEELGFSRPTLADGSKEYPWVLAIEDGRNHLNVKLTWANASGESRHFSANSAPVLDERGKVQGALATFDDLTQVEAKNAQLEKMLDLLKASRDEVTRQNEQLQILATRDPMTGCLNRRAFFGQFEELFDQAATGRQKLACIMTDIDHFKTFNDRHGHAVGDYVIKRVANCLQSTLRDDDRLGRYGGEEFCIMLPGLDADGAQRVAERIRRMIEAQNDRELLVTCSFGVSELEFGASTPDELIDQADQALYRAKENGRNQVVGWHELHLQHSEESAEREPARSAPVLLEMVNLVAEDSEAASDATVNSSSSRLPVAIENSTSEQRLFELEEDQRQHSQLLGVLTTLGGVFGELSGPQEFLDSLRRHTGGLVQFKSIAYLARESRDSDYTVVACDPADGLPRLNEEVSLLDMDGALRNALAQPTPVCLSALSGPASIFLHSLASRTQPSGLFMGELPEGVAAPDYVTTQSLSVIMQSAARALESSALQRTLRKKNAELAHALGERTRELQYGRVHDQVTGLPNRVLFLDRIERGVEHSKRCNTSSAIVLLDLDRFNRVNRLLGNAGGDRLLHEVGERINSAMRGTDSVARVDTTDDESTISRIGGDEFGVLLTDLKSIEDVRSAINRLSRALNAPFVIDERELFVTASMGVSLCPADSSDGETLMRNAETAMYQCKGIPNSGYRFFSADSHQYAVRQLHLEERMHCALRDEKFELHYQPKISVASGRITGLEALLRWQDDELGAVSPAEFIPAAEVSGLIVPIGAWALRAACRDASKWYAMGHTDIRVAVNLSAIQLLQSELVDEINAALEDSGLPPTGLEIEITESTIMRQMDRATAILKRLADSGISIAIDDFGTGYSSLSHLKQFPVDTLKIDGSFIREITTDSEDAAIVRATVAMAQSMGITTVAECVETREQMSMVRTVNCDEVQGYFFSKPVPFEEATALLNDWQGQDHVILQTG